ncbi:hypothetical protein [Streptomyces acidiscabies]|uniref:hypothetical protein n=1 Tax=Streptomyces acidiscabies TaxID=42234 RepID=UPI0013C4459D|nr:hypothetical protein [Streptomyces acidiscabies]MBP5942590.1 hypothetical protein [Streptomyces sp. LBUM 1476]
MIDTTTLNHTQRMEILVGMALAEYVDETHRRRKEKELAQQQYVMDVSDAASWAADQVFNVKAASLCDWSVTGREQSPEGMAEAAVVIPTGPCSVLLVFRAPLGTAQHMADKGSFFMVRECEQCATPHTDPVRSLVELGECLTRHQSEDLLRPHEQITENHDA